MKTSIKSLVLASAIALLGSGAANAAAVSTLDSAGGTNVLLTLVRTADSSSFTQRLNAQQADLGDGDEFALGAETLAFINDAGGAANVTFALIAGSAANAVSAATYLFSSADGDGTFSPALTNGVYRNPWFNSVSTFVTRLNTDGSGAADDGYGAFASGAPANYINGTTGGFNDFGTAGTNQYNTLGAATGDLFLYAVNFGTSAGQAASLLPLFEGAKANLNLTTNKLVITGTAVPLPASVLLLGTACAGLAGRRVLRRKPVA
jgi:hypothetical protein